MSGEDVTASRVRRMLPSVSEVLKELTSRAQIEPEIAFRAAREVCAEELKRIRDAGGDSAPLEDLVQRAFLRATGARLSPAPPPPLPLFIPPFHPSPSQAAASAAPAAGGPREPEDPFSETTGAMDLRWDRGDTREPFTEQSVPGASAPVLPVDEESPLVEDEPPALLFDTGDEPPPAQEPPPRVPILFAGSSYADAAYAGSATEATVVLPPEPEAKEGPGNETLTRLSREAESIDLNAVFPKPTAAAAVPFALEMTDVDAPGARERDPGPPATPFSDDDDMVLSDPRGRASGPGGEGRGARLGLILGVAVGVAALAGLGYLLVGLWVERGAAPTPVAVAKPRRTVVATVPSPAAPAAATTEAPAPEASPASSPEAAGTAPTAAPTAVPTVAPTAVPPVPTFAPPVPTAARVATAVPPAPVKAAPAPVVPSPVVAAPAKPPLRQSRDGLVVTPDRAGQPEIYAIHFTSYKDRASAERDLKRIQALAGREGFVAEVDLGEKGVWQRVMIGTFPTAQEAKAVREELAAKGTPNMGWVYRVVGP